MTKYIALIAIFFISFTSQAQERTPWSLDSCISYAQEMNIQINRSKLNIERVSQDKLNARASMLPSLNASFTQGYNFGKSIDPFTNTFATDQVQYGN